MFSPKFRITNRILLNIGKIEAAREVIENAPLVPSYEKKFREEAIIRTVHHGTHIEGNPLEQKEVAAVLEGKKVSARDRDIQEILNYREVLKYLNKVKDEPITEKIFLEIHRLTTEKILSGEVSGKYRKVQVKVSNLVTGEISYTPPNSSEVPDLLRSFFLWFNRLQPDEVHPVLTAGITHYLLAAIHPVTDGNGRAARALATLVLFKEGYDIKKFFSIEEYFDKDSESYYSALQRVSNLAEKIPERDLTTWLEYFTQGLAI